MKVLIVGGGGREHAIALKIKENPEVTALYAVPGNGGIAQIATCLPFKATDVDGIVRWAAENKVDFVIVAPDDPLCLGMVDALAEQGIPAFGPRKNAAIIEGSKVFSKNLMKKYGIPTAAYETFDDYDAAVKYLQTADMPIVVKADGLALGKGVLICPDRDSAVEAVASMMKEAKFGASGARVVIEEFLTGPEVSVLAFTDGKTVKPMVSSMDHKRALDHDEGLNTGGMGTIAPNPCYTPELARRCMDEIFLPTIAAMNAEGRTFTGCLYFGLMMTPKGPKVIEYNCRFGDPESIFYADPDELMLTEGADPGQLKLLENHDLAPADKILADAKFQASLLLEQAKSSAEKLGAPAQTNPESFSLRQLEAIDKINKQLDELNVMHATQIFRLKQALMTMATEK